MKITDDQRPLRMKDLAETTGYSESYLRSARAGFVNDTGEFRQLRFTHGPRCTAKAVWDFFAANPDFRQRKTQKQRVASKEKLHAA